jgi:hypothetical protein
MGASSAEVALGTAMVSPSSAFNRSRNGEFACAGSRAATAARSTTMPANPRYRLAITTTSTPRALAASTSPGPATANCADPPISADIAALPLSMTTKRGRRPFLANNPVCSPMRTPPITKLVDDAATVTSLRSSARAPMAAMLSAVASSARLAIGHGPMVRFPAAKGPFGLC